MNANPKNIQAVLFDVYGTLLEIARPTRPLQKLLRMASDQGVSINRRALTLLMSKQMTLTQAANQLGISLSESQVRSLELDLARELSSVRMYPEVPDVLTSLRRRGYRLGVCSNLAAPYVAPAKKLLEPYIDTAIWSCEVGLIKPDAAIYDLAVQQMGIRSDAILMVGDNYRADVEGPRAVGLRAKLLDRRRIQSDSEDSLPALEVLHHADADWAAVRPRTDLANLIAGQDSDTSLL